MDGITPKKLKQWVQKTPLEDMGSVLTALADKVYQHRLENKGYVPFPVFEVLLGPLTLSVQLVHEVWEDDIRIGFAVRKRDAAEAGDAYVGLYHSTCTSFRWNDDLQSALARDIKESMPDDPNCPIEYLGAVQHHESPRRNMDLTFMYSRRISPEDVPDMSGDWIVVTEKEVRTHDKCLIISGLHQLLWVLDGSQAPLDFLRETYPEQLR